MAITADGKTLAAGDMRGVIRFWDIGTGKETGRVKEPEGSSVGKVAFAGKVLVSTHWNRQGYTWHPDIDRPLQRFAADGYALGASADGKIAVTAQRVRGVTMHDSRKAKPVDFSVSQDHNVNYVQFTPGGKSFLAGSQVAGPLYHVDAATGQLLRKFGDQHVVHCAVSHDGETLATFSRPKFMVQLWDLETGKEKGKIADTPQLNYGALAFTPDGRSLLVGDQQGARLWDLESKKPGQSFPVGQQAILSPDGRWVCDLGERFISLWGVNPVKK